MTLSASVKLIVDALQDSAVDLGPRTARPGLNSTLNYSDGAGAGAANLLFSDRRQLAASGTENLDLAGVLTDAFGATLTFARIKAVIVVAATGNTNDVQVTRPASNGVPLFMAASDGIALKPGAMFAWADPGATGVVVTASTGDTLTVTNSSSGTTVDYDIIILGAAT